jgi:hypothetical protein
VKLKLKNDVQKIVIYPHCIAFDMEGIFIPLWLRREKKDSDVVEITYQFLLNLTNPILIETLFISF